VRLTFGSSCVACHRARSFRLTPLATTGDTIARPASISETRPKLPPFINPIHPHSLSSPLDSCPRYSRRSSSYCHRLIAAFCWPFRFCDRPLTRSCCAHAFSPSLGFWSCPSAIRHASPLPKQDFFAALLTKCHRREELLDLVRELGPFDCQVCSLKV
jgi:hypothetical protein